MKNKNLGFIYYYSNLKSYLRRNYLLFIATKTGRKKPNVTTFISLTMK